MLAYYLYISSDDGKLIPLTPLYYPLTGSVPVEALLLFVDIYCLGFKFGVS